MAAFGKKPLAYMVDFCLAVLIKGQSVGEQIIGNTD